MKNKIFLIVGALCLIYGCAPKPQSSSSKKKRNPLIVFDGKVIGDTSVLKEINPHTIESIEVIKYNGENSDYLDKFYGPKAKEGIIKITSKISLVERQNEMHKKLNDEIENHLKNPSYYLFVKDGVLVPEKEVSNLKKLYPADLVVVENLKFEVAKVIYGNNAKERTILINTKKLGKE